MRTFIPACFLAVIFSCGSTEEPVTHTPVKPASVFFADSGYSSIVVKKDTANGNEIYTKTRKTLAYEIVKLLWGKEYVNMLITEKSEQTSSDGAEGQWGYVELQGKVSEGGSFNKEIWKKRFDANYVNYDWDYFVLTTFGCCGAVDGKTACRYSDGEALLNFTGELCEVQIPNTRTSRYIGYWDFNSQLGRDESLKDPLALGMLTMVDPVSRSAQHIVVKAKSDSIFDQMNMAFNGITFNVENEKNKYNDVTKLLELWLADKADDPLKLTGFSIVLKFESDIPVEVELPVKNGRIDITALKTIHFTLEDKGVSYAH